MTTLITALIAAARSHVEAQTRRALITQTWRLVRDVWPADGRIAVLPAPLRALTAARVYDAEGATHSDRYRGLRGGCRGGAGDPDFAPWSLRQPGRPAAGIEIDVQVGYGDAAGEVPEPLRQAIRLLVAHWYENRGLVAVGQTWRCCRRRSSALIAPYRVLSL